jgi:hypothetical protein
MWWLSHAASMSTPPRSRQHYAASARISCSQPPVPCSQSFAVRRLAAAFCGGRSLDRCLFSMCHPELFGLMTSLTDRYQHILYTSACGPLLLCSADFYVGLILELAPFRGEPFSCPHLHLSSLQGQPIALSFDDFAPWGRPSEAARQHKCLPRHKRGAVL